MSHFHRSLASPYTKITKHECREVSSCSSAVTVYLQALASNRVHLTASTKRSSRRGFLTRGRRTCACRFRQGRRQRTQHPTLPHFTAPSSSLNLISNIEQTETDSSTQPSQVLYGLYSDLLSRSRTVARSKIPFPKLTSHLQILEKT